MCTHMYMLCKNTSSRNKFNNHIYQQIKSLAIDICSHFGSKHHEEVFVHGGLGSGGHLGRRACKGQKLLVMVFVQPTPTMVLRHDRSKKVFSHTPVHTTRHGLQPVHSRDPVKRFIARAASAVESASSERCGIGSYGL